MSKNIFFMLFNFRKSLFARLFILLIIIFVIAFIVITATWHSNINTMIYKNTLSHVTDNIKNSDNMFEEELKKISICVQTIAASDVTAELFKNGIKDDITPQFNNYISGYYDIYLSSIYGIAAVDTMGNKISVGLPYVPNDYSKTEWYNDIISKNGKCCFILRNIYGQKYSNNYITVGCAVMDSGVPIGVILMDIRTSLFIKTFGTSRINGATRTIVLDDKDNIIFCNDIILKPTQINTLIKRANSEDLYNKISEISFDGVTYIFTASKSSYTKWTNISFFRKSLIDSEYKSALKYTVFWILLVFLITILTASFIALKLSKK